MKILFTVEDLFIIEPLGIMQMAAFAKRLKHQCFFAIYSKNGFMEYIKEIRPDVVAISIMSISADSCIALVKKIKEHNKNIFIIVGGPHPTYYPDFIHLADVDAICIGEGDYAFVEILNALDKNEAISDIPNIITKDHINSPRSLVENLDDLPFPDHDLVYQNTRLGELKLKSFMATRGCPYSCTYCYNNGYKELYKGKGKILRRRSVDNIIAEIKMVQTKYPLEMIRFADDVFIEKKDDWLLEFVDKYSRLIKLPFYCLLYPKVINLEVAKLLKKAGCISVATSIDTGNEKIRSEILKRRISDQEIINACNVLAENGIRTYVNIMLGLPGATIQDEFKSLALAFKGRATCAAFTIFTPLPGTELREICLQKNLIPKTDKPVFPRSVTDRSMLNCFTEKEKDIQKNILLLGTLTNGSRLLRKIILKWLIYLPPNKIYFYISFIVRNYYHYRYIWPLKLNLKEFFSYAGIAFKHDKKYI